MGNSCNVNLPCNARDISQKYEFGRQIGRGHFGVVRICYDLQNGERYAVKIIDKSALVDRSRLQLEVTILQRAGKHPNVCYLQEVYEDQTSIYLVMEYCGGGDLLGSVIEMGKYSQERTTQVLKQVGSALQFLHKRGVVHRDLKPENIMLADVSPDTTVKLIDFGLAALVKENETTKTICGTWAYYAPEVVQQLPYDRRVDVWALGILMYILLSGYHPFDIHGDSVKSVVLQKILALDFNFNDIAWADVDNQAKDIIVNLLQLEPEARMTIPEFLETDYINSGPEKMEYIAEISSKYSRISRFRQLVELAATSRLHLNRYFRTFVIEYSRLYDLRPGNVFTIRPSRVSLISTTMKPDSIYFGRNINVNLLPIPYPPLLPALPPSILPNWLLSLSEDELDDIKYTIEQWLDSEKQERDKVAGKRVRMYEGENDIEYSPNVSALEGHTSAAISPATSSLAGQDIVIEMIEMSQDKQEFIRIPVDENELKNSDYPIQITITPATDVTPATGESLSINNAVLDSDSKEVVPVKAEKKSKSKDKKKESKTKSDKSSAEVKNDVVTLTKAVSLNAATVQKSSQKSNTPKAASSTQKTSSSKSSQKELTRSSSVKSNLSEPAEVKKKSNKTKS